jgi:hypothetical protein
MYAQQLMQKPCCPKLRRIEKEGADHRFAEPTTEELRHIKR